ncbi:EAL domain-containing protein [Enterobacteriaceae bacterium RIT691]|nr:EAL domain-containing protein [Enterobacteriaceae bacterium RIT691]
MDRSRSEIASDFIVKRISKNKKPFPVDIWFQPLFDLSRFKCVGGEVLVRGKYLRETIPPLRFINKLERHGTGIIKLGTHLVDEAFDYINKYCSGPGSHRIYNINVSRKELSYPGYADTLIAQSAHYNIFPAIIILEITGQDSSLTTPMKNNLETLLKHGFKIAWGDIYSLDMLQRKYNAWQAEYIKLDRRLIAATCLDETRNLIHQAHIRDINVIAEGIETLQQVSFLLKEKVTLGQGYLFSRPVTKEMFAEHYVE